VHDAHDTTIDFAASFLEYWLLPLLTDPCVNGEDTLIIVTFDENRTFTVQNRVFTVVFGAWLSCLLLLCCCFLLTFCFFVLFILCTNKTLQAPRSPLKLPTTRPTRTTTPCRTTGAPRVSGGKTPPARKCNPTSLCVPACSFSLCNTVSNAFSFVAEKTSHKNVNVPANQTPQLNLTGVAPGALSAFSSFLPSFSLQILTAYHVDSTNFVSFAASNLKVHGAGSGGVLARPGLNEKLTPEKPPPR
jgi:hypothetical protein